MTSASSSLPHYLSEDVLLHPEKREFPPFDLVGLLRTVFEPIEGCRICILTDFDDPAGRIEGFAFLDEDGHEPQKNAYRYFYQGLRNGGHEALGTTGGEMLAEQIAQEPGVAVHGLCSHSRTFASKS